LTIDDKLLISIRTPGIPGIKGILVWGKNREGNIGDAAVPAVPVGTGGSLCGTNCLMVVCLGLGASRGGIGALIVCLGVTIGDNSNGRDVISGSDGLDGTDGTEGVGSEINPCSGSIVPSVPSVTSAGGTPISSNFGNFRLLDISLNVLV